MDCETQGNVDFNENFLNICFYQDNILREGIDEYKENWEKMNM